MASVVVEGAPGYEAVRRPAIARFDGVRPRAVALCATPGDVAEALASARRSGLPVAARSGGHCFGGRSSTAGIVIDVTPMHTVAVDSGIATIGAGARLGDVYDALDEHGLTIAGGCGSTVGIAGLTLGGGLGLLGRRYGLTSDGLVGAQVVLADGRVVECDSERHADLFWALRGAGGGTVGIVTSLRFRTMPAPWATGLQVLWPGRDAAALIQAWQGWAPFAPDGLAASLLVTAAPGEPPVTKVFGSMLGTEAETVALIDELIARVGIEPVSAAFRHGSYRDVKRHLAGDEAEPGHPYSRSEFFRRPLPADAAVALVDLLSAERGGEARELDFTPWGGAYSRTPTAATAFAHRDASFLLKQAFVIAPDAPAAELDAARSWLARSWAAAHPWGTGGVYPNFPDPDLEDPGHAYHLSNHDRLVEVKARYDPDAVFDALGL